MIRKCYVPILFFLLAVTLPLEAHQRKGALTPTARDLKVRKSLATAQTVLLFFEAPNHYSRKYDGRASRYPKHSIPLDSALARTLGSQLFLASRIKAHSNTPAFHNSVTLSWLPRGRTMSVLDGTIFNLESIMINLDTKEGMYTDHANDDRYELWHLQPTTVKYLLRILSTTRHIDTRRREKLKD